MQCNQSSTLPTGSSTLYNKVCWRVAMRVQKVSRRRRGRRWCAGGTDTRTDTEMLHSGTGKGSAGTERGADRSYDLGLGTRTQCSSPSLHAPSLAGCDWLLTVEPVKRASLEGLSLDVGG